MYFKGCTAGDVRLLEGSTRLEGRVEFCKNNAWGTVCDSGWGTNDARVVCRQLGFSVTGSYHHSLYTFELHMFLQLPSSLSMRSLVRELVP